MSDVISVPWRGHHRLSRLWRGESANGLQDDWWVPVLMVEGRIVIGLLEELHRARIPAYCTRVMPGGLSFPRWCLWVGGSAYDRAEERLAEVLPLLTRSSRRGPASA